MALTWPSIAIIGCGLIGQKRFSSLPAGTVRVVCDVNLPQAKKLSAQSEGCTATASVEEAVRSPEVEVVVVATVNASLASISLQALEAGKHVLVEKPGAVSVSELDRLDLLARRRDRRVRVGYNHRYHPAILKAREIFDAGGLGTTMFVRARYGQGGRIGYEREWRANPKVSGGGELIDQGVHLIDLAGIFLGEFTSVDGHIATYYWNMPVEDNVFLSLGTAAGQTAWLHASCTEWKNTFSFEVYGRNGKLHVEGLGGSYGVERLYHYKMLPEMGPPETVIYEYPGPDTSWKLEMEEFLEDIQIGRSPVPSLKEARSVLRVVEQIYSKNRLASKIGTTKQR